VVAREGIDAVERDAGDGAVVAMRGAEVLGAIRVLDDEPVREVPPNRGGDSATTPVDREVTGRIIARVVP